jgi:hypothetical protein
VSDGLLLPGGPAPVCFQCGLVYGDVGWMDAVVPNNVWAQISPTGHEGGVLCITCMAKRCEVLGIECEVKITSGPFSDNRAAPGERDVPTNCQQEPGYPGVETVCCSLRAPNTLCHAPTSRCAIQEPHAWADCAEVLALPGSAPDDTAFVCFQ